MRVKTHDGGDPVPNLLSRGLEPVNRWDWALLGLAVFDILLILAAQGYDVFLPAELVQYVVPIDLAIVALFAVEFIVQVSRANDRLAYTRNHWYDLIGLVPITALVFRVFRLVRAARIWVVNNADLEGEESWHHALVRQGTRAFNTVISDELVDPIVVRGIQVVKEPLTATRYGEQVGDVLEEKRPDLRQAVRESLEETRGVGTVMRAQVAQRMVEETTDATLDSVINLLRSDELNETLQETIAAVLDETAYRFAQDRDMEDEVRELAPAPRPMDDGTDGQGPTEPRGTRAPRRRPSRIEH